MHYHLEVIMPPTNDVGSALAQVLAPFNDDAKSEEASGHPFWDWYQIGGRWSGIKVTADLDLDKFYEELAVRKVTVSGIVSGKASLQPREQIEMVDALWRDYFPECPIKVCPLFDHYEGRDMDIVTLADVSKNLKPSRVIIAGPSYQHNCVEAKTMLSDEFWNGVNYVKTTWAGTLESALIEHAYRIGSYKEEYVEKNTPRADWLVITVDYHN